MGGDLAVRVEPIPGQVPAVIKIDLYSAVMSGRTARTMAGYASDYRRFAEWLGATSPGAALDTLISMGQGAANGIVLAFKESMGPNGSDLKPNTIARRLAALKSAVKVARLVGVVSWHLDVESPKVETYRDCRGPGADGWQALLRLAKDDAAERTPSGLRNLALVRLLHDLGLRRNEAVSLNIADVDLDRSAVMVVGKGRLQASRLTMPPHARKAVALWIASRGPGLAPGEPLFTRLDQAASGGPRRLTGDGACYIIKALGRRAGIKGPVRPHGLRHEAITSALDRTDGNVRKVAQFSRHRDIRTLMMYDDSRLDIAGEVSSMISDDWE